LSEDLNDDSGAFDILRHGINRFPTDREVYSAAERVAIKTKRLDALDAQLSRVLSQSLDKETSILILENKAQLIKQRLNRFDEAADVYTKILKLDPGHQEAQRALRVCLEKGGRYLELVRLLEKQLSDTEDKRSRLALMKEIATIWERQLMNRWEAIEVWKKVKERAPDDPEAREALVRLQKSSLPSIRPRKE
jgi:tetratricopeptide (TPR) repeat protein